MQEKRTFDVLVVGVPYNFLWRRVIFENTCCASLSSIHNVTQNLKRFDQICILKNTLFLYLKVKRLAKTRVCSEVWKNVIWKFSYDKNANIAEKIHNPYYLTSWPHEASTRHFTVCINIYLLNKNNHYRASESNDSDSASKQFVHVCWIYCWDSLNN